MTFMVPAFADNAIFSSTEVFNVSKPNVFSNIQVDQIQTNQKYNAEARDRDRDQLNHVRQENEANVAHSLDANSKTGGNDFFLANSNLGSGGYIRADSRNKSGASYPVGSADNYDLNDSPSVQQINNNPQYVYYKQSVTVVNPNSPLYEGQVTPVTTGQQVANRNANQNVLFFCTAGNRAQTAEAFKQVKSADLSVWTDLESFNKCKAWAVAP